MTMIASRMGEQLKYAQPAHEWNGDGDVLHVLQGGGSGQSEQLAAGVDGKRAAALITHLREEDDEDDHGYPAGRVKPCVRGGCHLKRVSGIKGFEKGSALFLNRLKHLLSEH